MAPSKALKTQLALSMSDLTLFSRGLVALAEVAPERMSASQLAFFLLTGLADISNTPTTFTEVKDAVGPVIGRSLHTTYKVFLCEDEVSDKARQQALGWLTAESDSSDRRRKYLRLTERGMNVMGTLMETIKDRRA